MSHFVSRSSQDFESLQNQLLRRQPLDQDDLPQQEPFSPSKLADLGPSTSSSLASRRRLDVGQIALDDTKSQPTSPYSRRNSPELPEAAPSRPQSVASSFSDNNADYFSSPTLHPNPTASTSARYRVDLKHGTIQGIDPFSNTNGDTGSNATDPRYPHSTNFSRTSFRSRKATKGVSFSDKRVGPGEDGHTGRHRRLPRSNSGFQDSEPSFVHTPYNPPRSKSLGMISPAEMAPRKLGTWDGVFMPVSLNILGIILFLRFGFILGQAGLVGSLLLLIVSYAIDTLTAMSLSAISTNGQVRGGGAYYLISRSLGPEFGGSIGLIFFSGQALNAAMNVLGFVETLTDAFGESRGPDGFLPQGPWYSFFYGSLVLLISTLVCLVGSNLFARATLVLALILSVSIFSIPISSLIVSPFIDEKRGVFYTGWSLDTMRANLFPRFTSGAAGSSSPSQVENWQSVFGVLFPAVTGILAGASMSGDLRKPSKSIPKGTNYSLLFTFIVYALSFIVFAGTIQRQSFYIDAGIVSDVAASPQIITFGSLASTAFSALMGVMACGKVLQAIARDNLLPVLDRFGQGTEISDTPTFAVLVTYIICQMILFVDSVNTIAQLVTMTTLLTFGTLCFATCALKAGGAPSFRPSFKYWNIWTAAAGAISCFSAMFFTNALAASACLVVAIFLFVAIHIFSPPKPWGDVTRNITYHFVRKYLLRLDERKGHVKYWRPQILLLANNPRTEWNLIIFCNSLKKGALYVLGHVLKGEFNECLPELRKQQIAWLKLVDLTGIKSFVDVVIAPDERQGARNLILSCGLGGMRPNIVVMGYPSDLQHPANVARGPVSLSPNHRSDGSEITIRGMSWPYQSHRTIDIGTLPTDVARKETPIKPTTYVGIMEDALALNKALAVAYGFDMMNLPGPSSTAHYEKPVNDQYIDLWPIQIASPNQDDSHAWDTYTMVLQLGTILSLTGTWKAHKLRVSVFVEHTHEVEDERKRIRSLLDNLRIAASLRVFCLVDPSVTTYRAIVYGDSLANDEIENALKGDRWWEALKQLRRQDERRAKMAAAAKRRSQYAAQPIPTLSKKQTKRDQKLLGVSLPAEHLAFHKQNIRLGLAHPRSRRSDAESDADDTDFSDDSDSEDELALLSEDDDWFGSGSSPQNLGLRRSSTIDPTCRSRNKQKRKPRAYSIGGSAGLPDDPITRPLYASSISGNASSYGSLSSSQRTATPANVLEASTLSSSIVSTTSTIISTDSSETPRASMFLDGFIIQDTQPDKTISDLESDIDSTLKASDRIKAQEHLKKLEVKKEWSASTTSNLNRDRPTSVMSKSSSVIEDSGSESEHRPEPEKDAVNSRRPSKSRSWRSSMHTQSRSEEIAGSNSGGPSRSKPSRTNHRVVSAPVSSVHSTEKPLISFNELPNKAQYIILNELIRINSTPATSVVLTALPAPEPGTSLDEIKSLKYLEQLESLFHGGPPVLGVHAKTLTMTMSL